MTLDTYAHVIEELETGERVPAEGVIYAARGELVRTVFARDTEDVPTDPAELLDLQEFPESPLKQVGSPRIRRITGKPLPGLPRVAPPEKLRLPVAANTHRRVLAVVAFLQS